MNKVFFMLLLLSPILHARLGETSQQCHKRYENQQGPKERNGVGFYAKQSFGVMIFFHNDKAYCAHYSKPNYLIPTKPLLGHPAMHGAVTASTEMSTAEIVKILSIYSEKDNWKIQRKANEDNGGTSTYLVTNDAKYSARLYKNKNVCRLEIADVKARKEANKVSEKPSL